MTARIAVMKNFPKNEEEFLVRFGTEDNCRRYLFDLRWPEGFVCPVCSGRTARVNKKNFIVCTGCQAQISLTSGTILHGTKKRLALWFRAIWWICTHQKGGSARELQQYLGLGSYQTAWVWFQKLRRAMSLSEGKSCGGRVEMGQGMICDRERDGKDYSPYECAKVLAAGEVVASAPFGLGRTRISLVPDFSRSTISGFLRENIEQSSTIVTTEDLESSTIESLGYGHEVIRSVDVRDDLTRGFPPHVASLIGDLASWLIRTHKGGVKKKHLQQYIDEYVFRHSMNLGESPVETFNRILKGGVEGEATPYWRLVGKDRPQSSRSREKGHE